MRTTISCVPTNRCEWPLQRLTSVVATVWHNAMDSALQPWQRAKRTDGGQRGKSSVICFRRSHPSPIEIPEARKAQQPSKDSSMQLRAHGSESGKMKDLPRRLNEEKTSPKSVLRGLIKLSTMSNGNTPGDKIVCSPGQTAWLVSWAFLLLEPSVFLLEYIPSFQSAFLPLRF